MSSEVAISPPTVAVIGGGWYGCHIAYTLRQRGFVVTLFESAPEIFTGASGKNQFRLHAGFHYPRSQNTRKQITRGLMEFNKRMPQFVKKLDSCIYAISNQSSLLDFGTFTSVFEAEQVPFEHVHPQVYGLSNVEGAVHTPTEEYFLVDTPRSFYKHALGTAIKTGVTVRAMNTVTEHDGSIYAQVAFNEMVQNFDWCVNCTYNQLSRISTSCFYEVCLTLIYEQIQPRKEIIGITIMDGEFCSLYPYVLDQEDYDSGRRRYTLTHVKFTPMFSSQDFSEAKEFMSCVDEEEVQKRVPKFERGFLLFYPAFKHEFKLVDWFTSIKTKPLDSGASNHTASRECLAEEDGRVISVLSGKINTLFEAERKVLQILLRSWSKAMNREE